MPRILDLKKVDGKLAVLLDMPETDEGSVTVWTEAEKDAALAKARHDERMECGRIAAEYGGHAADEIAEQIMRRSFPG